MILFRWFRLVIEKEFSLFFFILTLAEKVYIQWMLSFLLHSLIYHLHLRHWGFININNVDWCVMGEMRSCLVLWCHLSVAEISNFYQNVLSCLFGTTYRNFQERARTTVDIGPFGLVKWKNRTSLFFKKSAKSSDLKVEVCCRMKFRLLYITVRY